LNRRERPQDVPAPSGEAAGFHRSLAGYEPTRVRELPGVARELGLGWLGLKDESSRLGLPAFKVLGASWAAERVLAERPETNTFVAASAGNHGRAVAHVAASRGLACHILLPTGSVDARRQAIADEGAEVTVTDGDYEEAVALAAALAEREGVVAIGDVGDGDTARWVIDGYATLFSEAEAQAEFDLMLVPIGVGSLGAAAARFGAHAGIPVIGVEPATAACLTASLAAGEPTAVPTPGTTMAGLNCAEISIGAWPSLRDGLRGTVTVDDTEVAGAVRELAGLGLAIGESGAAPLAALRALASDPDCAELASAVGLGPERRVLLIATEGPTNPESYRAAVG
jgi:diaminopropionate ammonia-lyase